jgi:hypothetical protein
VVYDAGAVALELLWLRMLGVGDAAADGTRTSTVPSCPGKIPGVATVVVTVPVPA